MTMEKNQPGDTRAGARNLLLGCVGVRTGEDVLIVREDAGLGYYDAAVVRVRDHYRRLGALFDIDAYTVNSWHAGINPATFYPTPARDDVERWAGVAFGSPRYTRFHSCGTDPGEIAWSVFDATIALDGEDYWRDGRFVFLDRHDQRALLATYPDAARAFEIRRDIGL